MLDSANTITTTPLAAVCALFPRFLVRIGRPFIGSIDATQVTRANHSLIPKRTGLFYKMKIEYRNFGDRPAESIINESLDVDIEVIGLHAYVTASAGSR